VNLSEAVLFLCLKIMGMNLPSFLGRQAGTQRCLPGAGKNDAGCPPGAAGTTEAVVSPVASNLNACMFDSAPIQNHPRITMSHYPEQHN